jgi:hypothetical protein
MSVSKCRVVLQLRPSGVAKASARSEQYVVRVHHIPRSIGRDCPDCSCGQSAKESEEEESEEDGDLELAWGSSSCAGEAFQHLFQARYSLEP